ncbi:MAG TPA: hypothetical protein VH560_18850 [Polyangia bacterium]|jgi:hypothetical protein|nr:hypothetical protein [Polyangia bacterium]
MLDLTILVMFCCAKCSERRELFVPSGDFDVFERSLLEYVPDQWTKIANGHFECNRHRPDHIGVFSSPLRGPANTVRR